MPLVLLKINGRHPRAFNVVAGPLHFEGVYDFGPGVAPCGFFIKIGSRLVRCRRFFDGFCAGSSVAFKRDFSTSGGLKWIRLFARFSSGSVLLWSGFIFNYYTKAESLVLNPPQVSSIGCNSRRGGGRVAIVMHLYYEDLWCELSNAIGQIPEPFDLFITARDSISPEIVASIIEAYPDAKVIKIENKGRDILPFLIAMKNIERTRYEYVCKVHSKKAPHRIDGEQWRRHLIHDLLGSREIIKRLLAHFDANPKLGLVAPWDNLTDYDSLPGTSQANVSQLKHRMGVSGCLNFPFPKGSMFWARMAAMEPLMAADIQADEFASEAGQMDGTMAHAVERIFGLSAICAGFTCEEAPEFLPPD